MFVTAAITPPCSRSAGYFNVTHSTGDVSILTKVTIESFSLQYQSSMGTEGKMEKLSWFSRSEDC